VPEQEPNKDTRTLTETQASSRTDILERIVRTKREELEALLPRGDELRERAADAAPPRDFAGALRAGGEVALIAEVKRRSPGAGAIRPGLDPVALARGYVSRGARAVSVLTDEPWFGGSLDDLRAVRREVRVPVLRKDFTIAPIQLHEARAAGADAVLLIVRILSDARLAELHGVATELGMAALVEVHDGSELERALRAGARIVGINNRDLATFTTDLETTLGLLDQVPTDRVVVSESGVRTPADVERLGRVGVDAVLVGESLLRAPDPAEHAARLSGRPRRERGSADD